MTMINSFSSVWCRMHEEKGKTTRKTKPDAGMGDGWSKIQVRNIPCHCYLSLLNLSRQMVLFNILIVFLFQIH